MRMRTRMYQEQREMMISSKPTRGERPRPLANVPETWDRLETISVRLNRVLQDLFEIMRQPSPGGLAPEFSISLIADLPELPPAIKAPARQKPVSPRGRHCIVAGGRVDAHTVIAKVEIVARVVVYGLPNEGPRAGMSRNTWFLPLKSGEKRDKHHKKQQDGK